MEILLFSLPISEMYIIKLQTRGSMILPLEVKLRRQTGIDNPSGGEHRFEHVARRSCRTVCESIGILYFYFQHSLKPFWQSI